MLLLFHHPFDTHGYTLLITLIRHACVNPLRNQMRKPCCHIFAGGDSKTLMVVQVAPVRKNAGETFCSLDFASRVRNVELGQATKKVESVDSPYKSDVSEDIILISIVFLQLSATN